MIIIFQKFLYLVFSHNKKDLILALLGITGVAVEGVRVREERSNFPALTKLQEKIAEKMENVRQPPPPQPNNPRLQPIKPSEPIFPCRFSLFSS